eukprot:TRINITY_DN1773_c0_g1_i1.p1 TRINITY_DN1773_c0_g1~~TRINITY_DN1773_c0_g1_i1.p1  ORF type:complete len:378 (+),score=15.65 TRINITY_DN1773_c0_g1_i1:724-1857(+)
MKGSFQTRYRTALQGQTIRRTTSAKFRFYSSRGGQNCQSTSSPNSQRPLIRSLPCKASKANKRCYNNYVYLILTIISKIMKYENGNSSSLLSKTMQLQSILNKSKIQKNRRSTSKTDGIALPRDLFFTQNKVPQIKEKLQEFERDPYLNMLQAANGQSFDNSFMTRTMLFQNCKEYRLPKCNFQVKVGKTAKRMQSIHRATPTVGTKLLILARKRLGCPEEKLNGDQIIKVQRLFSPLMASNSKVIDRRKLNQSAEIKKEVSVLKENKKVKPDSLKISKINVTQKGKRSRSVGRKNVEIQCENSSQEEIERHQKYKELIKLLVSTSMKERTEKDKKPIIINTKNPPRALIKKPQGFDLPQFKIVVRKVHGLSFQSQR